MPKTEELAGMEGPGVGRVKIKAIETAADRYKKVRDERMTLTEKEVLERGKLVEVVQANLDKLPVNDKGQPFYRFDDEEVVLIAGKTKVKVRHVAENGESQEEDDD